MAEAHGKKSEYLIKNDRNNYLSGFAIAISLFVLIYVFYASSSGSKLGVSVVPASIIFLTIFFLLKSKSEWLLNVSDRFSKGRFAEYAVCDQLKKLPAQYSVFRNIRLGDRGDIDLVVAGPTGVFAIEVKSHEGNIYFNSREQKLERNHKLLEKNFIGQARAEAMNLKKYLSEKTGIANIFVDAVLVFSSEKAKLCFASDVASNIQIVKKESLNNVIMGGKNIIEENKLALLNEKLKELAT